MAPARFEGRATWNAHGKYDRSTNDVRRAIRRDDAFVLDIDTPFGPYVVTLQGTGELTGTWTRAVGNRKGSCSVRLFDAGGGDLFLFGEWREGDEMYDWWTELSPAEAQEAQD